MFWDGKPIFPSYWPHTFKKGPLEGAKRRDMSEPSDQSWIKGSDKQEQPERFHIWTACQSVSRWKDLQGRPLGVCMAAALICSECGRKAYFLANTTNHPDIFSQPHCNPYHLSGHESILTVLRIASSECVLHLPPGSIVPDYLYSSVQRQKSLSERLKLYSSLSIK